MNDTINYVAKNGIVINGTVNGKDFEIKFNDIYSYWSYATQEDCEGGVAKVIGEKILFTMLTASGQGGIIVLWDINNKKVDHISEGSYSVAVDMCDDMIYSLHCVFNYNTKAHFRLYKTACGIKDAFHEGVQVDVEIPDIVDEYDGDYNDVDLSIRGPETVVILKGNEYKLKHRGVSQ